MFFLVQIILLGNTCGKVESYLIRVECRTQVLSLLLRDDTRSDPTLKDLVKKKKDNYHSLFLLRL
jgi:hypothetical protein